MFKTIFTYMAVIMAFTFLAVTASFIFCKKRNKIKISTMQSILIGGLATVIIGGVSYVFVGAKVIENKTKDYLLTQGYTIDKIKDIEVSHSFLNILLSYNEWIIKVVYEDEPESVYTYYIDNGEIEKGGVSTSKEKQDLKHR